MRVPFLLAAILVALCGLRSATAHNHKPRTLLQELDPQAAVDGSAIGLSNADGDDCGTPSLTPVEMSRFVQQLAAFRAASASAGVQSAIISKVTVPVVVTVVEPVPGDEVEGR